MRRIRTYAEVGESGADVPAQVAAQQQRLRERLAGVRHVLAVGSGKGGVGKSAVAANLAAALAAGGWRVGAVDGDLNGPSLGRMLAAERAPLRVSEGGVRPASGAAGVSVMSSDLFLDDDAALRWGGEHEFLWQSTLETGTLREFMADVDWGELDCLVVDLAPGTDKLTRLLALDVADLVLLVTTPAAAATHVVAKSLAVARGSGVPFGLVANMTHHVCRECGAREPLYVADAAGALAASTGAPMFAEVPFDARLASETDAGRPVVLGESESPAARALRALADRVREEFDG